MTLKAMWCLAVGVILAAVAGATPAQAQLTTRAQADKIMQLRYESFVTFKGSKPAPYDWSDDGCSPGWMPKFFYRNLFNKPCQQHDFGYRNYGKGLMLGRNEETRAWIDDRFLTEMKRLCNENFSGRWRTANRVKCRSDARAVWSAVRNLGRSAFYGAVTSTGGLVGHIVQWDGDKKAQKTAWLVGGDGKRRWIPSAAVYNCLKSQGRLGPTVLTASVLDRLPDLTGVHATCSTPLPPVPTVPSQPADPAPPTTAPSTPAPLRRVITVDNRVTNGMAMREDSTPARLTTQPWIRCSSRGCNIAGTERGSGGTYDAAVCQANGERTTNGHDTSPADDANPERFESTRYYGVQLSNGTFGYVSEVWIRAADRGGLGLPGC